MEKDNNKLEIYDLWSLDIPIIELKKWVDSQIENGNTAIGIDIEWGYYSDIDKLTLVAKK